MDASIIQAPSSTENRARERDSGMHHTKKGNEWRFRMKMHIGVDADTGLVHSMTAAAANVHDVTGAHRLLHGGETPGVGRRRVSGGPQAGGEPGAEGGMAGGDASRIAPAVGAWERCGAGGKAQGVGESQGGAPVPEGEAGVRLRQGVRYRGLAKNAQRLALLPVLAT